MEKINLNAETITLYAKQLRTPSFNRYEEIIRQLEKDQGYEYFLSLRQIFYIIVEFPKRENASY